MSYTLVCRICLSCDVRMYSISGTPLQEIYEKLTDSPLQTRNNHPDSVCYVCYYQLRKCQKLICKSVKSNQILLQLYSTAIEITKSSLDMIHKQYNLLWPLTVSPMETITSLQGEADDGEVKLEVKHEDQKVEIDYKDTLSPLELPTHDSTDSEDDLPLHAISEKKHTKMTRKKRLKSEKGEGTKTAKIPRIIPDAKEIILTKEEQIQQMVERSKSHNYLNSPYKCELCFKGFVDTKAFENHQEKHSERSGPFSCNICHMRYQSARLARTHAAAAHSRRYLCNKCGHRSHTANQARDHEKWHSGYTYECQLCGQKFRKPTSYLTHMRKRHPTEHICNMCGESYVSRHGLAMHKRKAHTKAMESVVSSDTPSQFCAECNIHFVSIEAWTKHVMTSLKHTLATDARSACLICGEEVQSSLQTHLKQHEDAIRALKAEKRPKLNLVKVTCDLCGLEFVNRSKLHAHVKRIHLGKKYDKNIVCEVCGKKCTSNASLKSHQRTHSGERPFACAQCPKRFSDRNQLTIHGRTHSGVRPYACRACDKRFTQRPALNRHCRVHTGAKPYDCQYCSKNFSQSNSLKIHVNTVHLKLPPRKKAQATPLGEEGKIQDQPVIS